MNTSIVLTIIAKDQPGIINAVSKILYKHGGGWTQSSMNSLAGQFAGILLASVPAELADTCVNDLEQLKDLGLNVIAHVSDPAPETQDETQHSHKYTLDLVGNDRKGIVHDISTILTKHNINVQNLETLTQSASMGGGELFRATAELNMPADTDIHALEDELEELANELMVDITFEN